VRKEEYWVSRLMA